MLQGDFHFVRFDRAQKQQLECDVLYLVGWVYNDTWWWNLFYGRDGFGIFEDRSRGTYLDPTRVTELYFAKLPCQSGISADMVVDF